MNTKRRFLPLFTVLVVALSSLGWSSVAADSESVDYVYLIGMSDATVPLCALDPSACPDISMADNGDTIELTGSGTLTTHPKSVTGGGTFTHKAPDGTVLGSGIWTAEKLSSFNGYGCADLGLTVEVCGGLAVIQVHIVSDAGPEFDGTMQVDCLIGTFPAGAKEGVRLAFHDVGLNFNHEVSGFTVYYPSP